MQSLQNFNPAVSTASSYNGLHLVPASQTADHTGFPPSSVLYRIAAVAAALFLVVTIF